MGCDIHTVAQIKDRNGKFLTVADDIADEWRSYDSYAVLANVRNGRGVAGYDTGEGWEPIDEPRGLPEDFSCEEETHTWDYSEKKKWMGEHSYSWVTLDELKKKLDTYKDKSYEIHGVITVEEFNKLKDGEKPDSWCSWTGGPGVVVVSEGDDLSNATHVKAKWKVPALNNLTYLVNCVRHLELLRDISYYNNLPDEDVRMVFGFDS